MANGKLSRVIILRKRKTSLRCSVLRFSISFGNRLGQWIAIELHIWTWRSSNPSVFSAFWITACKASVSFCILVVLCESLPGFCIGGYEVCCCRPEETMMFNYVCRLTSRDSLLWSLSCFLGRNYLRASFCREADKIALLRSLRRLTAKISLLSIGSLLSVFINPVATSSWSWRATNSNFVHFYTSIAPKFA